MNACVIFNPTAKGNKVRKLRKQLDLIGSHAALKQTVTAGDARRLAAGAVNEGFDTIVAAGGDGTLNEVLNGIGDTPDGFARARLGVLPLGTVNVFARELKLPEAVDEAWEVVRRGKETTLDLASVEFGTESGPQRRFFVQLAGAGLDARAIELVKWQVKKLVGPLAYVLAGLHAVLGEQSTITASGGGKEATGELVLIGNGRLYGGNFRLFPRASLTDGLLDVCIIRRGNLLTLFRCAPALLLNGSFPDSLRTEFQAASFTLKSDRPTPLQVEGELIGHLPATFRLEPARLRLIGP